MNAAPVGNTPLALVYLMVGAFVFLLGIVILREAPRERANRATALMLFSSGIGSVLGSIGFLLDSLEGSGGRGAANDFLRTFNYLWEIFFPSLLFFACVFPTENRFFRRIPFASLWIFAPHVFHFVLMLLSSQTAFWARVGAEASKNPLGGILVTYGRIPFEMILRFHQILFSLVNIVYIVLALILLWASFRKTHNTRVRRQVGTIFAGLASCATLYAFAVPLPTLFNHYWQPLTRSTLIVSALILGSGSIAYAMVRHRFLDANVIARKSVLYGVTSVFLFGVYILIVRRLDAMLASVTAVDTTVFQTAFLLISLVLFQPVFSWLEEALDRVFLRDRGDPRALLRRVSGEVLTVLDLDTLAEKLLSSLREGVPARTTVLLIAAGPREPLARGSGGGVDLAAIAAIPRDPLIRLLDGSDLLRREEIAPLAADRGVETDVRPVLATEPYVILPLRYGGAFLGFISLGRKITETRYTAVELELLQTLANQTSVAITNALLYRDSLEKSILEEELSVARRIQQQSLPTKLPQTSGFGLAALNAPSKFVGGDYYDTVQLGPDRYLVAIADVAGKGVPAALLASMVQASIRTQAFDRQPVGVIMERLNRLVHEATPEDRFATCFLAEVSADGLRLSSSNAGHNYPILRSSEGGCRVLDQGGIPLGIEPEHTYTGSDTVLRPGDTLLMYTDGITDARNRLGEDFGEERLLEVVKRLPDRLTADEIIREVADEVSRFTDGAEQIDDITLVALKAYGSNGAPASHLASSGAASSRESRSVGSGTVPSMGGSSPNPDANSKDVVHLSIPSRLEELAQIHAAIEDLGRRHHLDEELVQALQIAVIEAGTNAVQHGNVFSDHKSVQIEFVVTPGEIAVQVDDYGEGFDPSRVPDPTEGEHLLDLHGRGLFLMRSLMDDVSFETRDDKGTRVRLRKARAK
ncbi:MAG TPA: SpoIIE family protein phosphatase [Candidatus Eisenbacteria bacterium]|nr:SpoIIE family protein phosphatase [Candidatus Eisenbacteria bacterium]